VVCTHTARVCVGKLYAVGGHDGNEHLKSGEVFEPLTNSWTSIAPMSKLRSVHSTLYNTQFNTTTDSDTNDV